MTKIKNYKHSRLAFLILDIMILNLFVIWNFGFGAFG